MATKQTTVDFIVEQIQTAGDIRSRKMFGDYAVYCDNKVVALVCDDMLYLKITKTGEKLLGGDYPKGAAYPGAKPSFAIDEKLLEDRERLTELIRVTADALPLPKPKKSKA